MLIARVDLSDEVWFPEIPVSGNKNLFWWRKVDLEKCIPVSGYKIYILIKYVDFQKGIPVSGYKIYILIR